MATSVAACFQLVHLPPVRPRRPWRLLTPDQINKTKSHSLAMLLKYNKVWACGFARTPSPASEDEILFRRVPNQATAPRISRKISVWYQGAIRRRHAGAGAGGETVDTWAFSLAQYDKTKRTWPSF